MFIQEASARSRSRLTAVLVALALMGAVLVVAIQASSITSTTIGPQVPAHSAVTANPDPPRSIHISKSCRRRKFGCGTPTASPDLRTSSRTPGRCWRRKFGCGDGATTSAKRP